jgi:arsenate reductase
LTSKSWHTFCWEGAPVLDFVIVVCDLAALQTQPQWPGSPVKLWWNFTPPGAARELEAALSKFVLLPFEEINRDEWSSLAHCVPVKV